MEALDRLVRSGQGPLCRLLELFRLASDEGAGRRPTASATQRFVCQQIHYTLQAREAEYELVPITIDQGLGILVWSPLAGGLLSGKHRRDKSGPADSRQLAGWNEPPIRDEEQLYDIVDVLVEIGEARGVSAAQVALAWLLGRPGVTSLVIGARTEAQLADNLAAADLKLTDEERARLDTVSRRRCSTRTGISWTAKDRLGAADLALLAPYIAEAEGGASPK